MQQSSLTVELSQAALQMAHLRRPHCACSPLASCKAGLKTPESHWPHQTLAPWATVTPSERKKIRPCKAAPPSCGLRQCKSETRRWPLGLRKSDRLKEIRPFWQKSLGPQPTGKQVPTLVTCLAASKALGSYVAGNQQPPVHG